MTTGFFCFVFSPLSIYLFNVCRQPWCVEYMCVCVSFVLFLCVPLCPLTKGVDSMNLKGWGGGGGGGESDSCLYNTPHATTYSCL